jgi:hypothetical protein
MLADTSAVFGFWSPSAELILRLTGTVVLELGLELEPVCERQEQKGVLAFEGLDIREKVLRRQKKET